MRVLLLRWDLLLLLLPLHGGLGLAGIGCRIHPGSHSCQQGSRITTC
jgi:hypothetical protein